jgi:nitrogen PTS system EIIA component
LPGGFKTMATIHVNVIQLAESLGVEESVVENWVKHDSLPCMQDSGRLIFDRTQVAAWATERGLAVRAGFLSPVSSGGVREVNLSDLLRRGGIWRNVPAGEVRQTIAQSIQGLPAASPQIVRMLAQRILSPGGITWAPVGDGIALPHLRSRVSPGKDSGLIAVLFLNENLRLDEPPDEGQVLDRLLFFIAPTPRAHLEVLANLTMALTRGGLKDSLRAAAGDDEIFEILAASDKAKDTRP